VPDELLTCAILCYNYGRYLTEAIESVLGQENADGRVECLVIDDGSTDETPAVCAKYSDRIRYLRTSHSGFAATLTRAVEEAHGGWVCLLDEDDRFKPSKLRTVLPLVRAGWLSVEHCEHVIDSQGNPLIASTYPGGCTSTLCFARDAALPLLPAANEVFFHVLRMAGHGVEIREPLIDYRVHDRNMTDRRRRDRYHSWIAEVTDLLVARLRALQRVPPEWTDRHQLARIAAVYYADARRHEAAAATLRGRWFAGAWATTRSLMWRARLGQWDRWSWATLLDIARRRPSQTAPPRASMT